MNIKRYNGIKLRKFKTIPVYRKDFYPKRWVGLLISDELEGYVIADCINNRYNVKFVQPIGNFINKPVNGYVSDNLSTQSLSLLTANYRLDNRLVSIELIDRVLAYKYLGLAVTVNTPDILTALKMFNMVYCCYETGEDITLSLHDLIKYRYCWLFSLVNKF